MDSYCHNLSKEEKLRAIDMGKVFASKEGKEYLSRTALSYIFSTIDEGDAQAIARHNDAVALLAELGIFRKDNIEKVFDNLIEMRYKGE